MNERSLKRRQVSRARGFTLIEILVVMAILGLLVALVGPQVIGQGDAAKVDAAKAQLRSMGTALDLYKLDNYNYPSTEQGLDALVSKPSGSPEPKNYNRDGYMKSVPLDPWKNPYQYISPGSNGPYDLYSWGADGREGGAEDGTDLFLGQLDQ